MADQPQTRTPRPSTLTADQLTQLREMLVEQRTFRLDQLAQLHQPGTNGPLSCAVPEVFDELAAGARAALRDVLAALRRMAEGSYGRCTSCYAAVEPERLEILPQAAFCTGCQRARCGRSTPQ